MSNLEEARRALFARQGGGARYDAPEAPADMLMLARTGTAYFARFLSLVPDRALYAALGNEAVSAAHVVCAVSYQARAIARQAEAITAGEPPPPFYDSAEALKAMIDLGATLPARALRHLFDHSAVHLNVVWRDLPGGGWKVLAAGADGVAKPFSQSVRDRACFIWSAAFTLNNGARQRDIPVALRAAGCPEFAV